MVTRARKKNPIPNKKERMILSDILPYELPITFSNRRLYDFLIKHKIAKTGDEIKWLKGDDALTELIRLIFWIEKTEVPSVKVENNEEYYVFKFGKVYTVPFKYKISHKESDYRELTIIHPRNQLSLVNFYDQYRELILYYSGISQFSIRRPYKVAKFTFHRDKTHLQKLAHDHEHNGVEEFDKEYENLKTFFVYKDMSNIHKFYESYRFHRCEKKYNHLVKLDISKCFDSIYTHSIAWALLNKGIVKENLNESKGTFAGKFDVEMQCLNYGETNGIVIGPEFSRIFAELILQQIDADVQRELPYKHKVDYEIFRYVDDFFVFYNDKLVAEKIIETYKLKLNDYKLYLNDSKFVDFDKPIITGITRSKLKISKLLNDFLDIKVKKVEVEDASGEVSVDNKYSFYLSSNRLITQTKAIIKETEVSYKDILIYTFACIDRKVLRLVKTYSAIEEKAEEERHVLKSIQEILDFVFFLYSVSPRVNTTIKLCMILSKLIKLAKIHRNFNYDNRHLILKKIYDEVSDVFRKNRSKKHTQVETLYLLILLKDLGKDYRLSSQSLAEYFNINLIKEECDYPLNYFSIVVLLFYIEDKKRYLHLQNVILKHVIGLFKETRLENRGKKTELVLLLLDLIACPYIDDDFKKGLLDLHGVDSSIQLPMLSYHVGWFTRWVDFDFGKELEAKRSQEVY
jgi:hypothetical protein